MKLSREETIFDIFENKLPEHYQSDIIRSGQVQMAMDIAAFLHRAQREAKYLFIEAPVGTGKSLGALVPSLIDVQLEKGFSRKRIVYATATINLQGQLMSEEVPILKKFGLLENVILAKGKQHYYCHKEAKSKKFRKKLTEQFFQFYTSSSTGQRDEFEQHFGEIENSIWEKVSFKGSKRDCDACSFRGACSTAEHRSKFLLDKNELVITNHDQFIQSVLHRLGEPQLPPIVPINPGIVIIDEAHHFQENFLSRLQETYTVRDLRSLALNHRFPNRHRGTYLSCVNNLEQKLKLEAEKVESLQGRYPLPQFVPEILKKMHDILDDVINTLTVEQSLGFSRQIARDDEYMDNLEKVSLGLRRLVNERDYASWVTYEDYSLSCIGRKFPTEFRNFMNYIGTFNKIVIMSGTLTANSDFEALIKQWRLPKKEVQTKTIAESFQYQKQALIYVPQDVVDPREPIERVIADQVKQLEKLLHLTGGRTLCLSTSKQHMEALSNPLSSICKSLGVNFLQQEQSGVEQLTKRFKNDETSVLLGSGSFFSGFSVSGTSLVSVIFTRLPFPVRDDPFLELIGEGYDEKEKFDEIIFPNMMVKLNQGIGRLIRDIRDYGIITILDPRVFNDTYGNKIRDALERKGYRFTRSFDEVVTFYERKIQSGSETTYTTYERSQINVNDVLKEFGAEAKLADIKVPNKNKKSEEITEEQKQFAIDIFKQNNLLYPKKIKKSKELFEALVDVYYKSYRDPKPVIDNFPYKDEKQRASFSSYKGSGGRGYIMQKCTHEAFGCDGVCSPERREIISKLVSSSGGNIKKIYESKGFCWLDISPQEEIERIMELCLTRSKVAIDKEG